MSLYKYRNEPNEYSMTGRYAKEATLAEVFAFRRLPCVRKKVHYSNYSGEFVPGRYSGIKSRQSSFEP
jgi:hypothetical protein